MANSSIGTKAARWTFKKLLGVLAPKGLSPDPISEDWVEVAGPDEGNDTGSGWVTGEEPEDKIFSTIDKQKKSGARPNLSLKVRLARKAKSKIEFLRRPLSPIMEDPIHG